jgi:hypothetical protein
MRPVDPPGHVYQKVGQLASKSGPAATGREIISLELLQESGRPVCRKSAVQNLGKKLT